MPLLSSFQKAPSGISGLPVLLGGILDAAIAIAGADFGNIQLLWPDGDLRIVVHRGFPDWWVDYWNTVTTGRGVCGTALGNGERVIVDDVAQSPIFVGTPALDIQLRAGVRAVQSTPLRGHSGDILGMFSTHYRTPHRPDAKTLQILDMLALHAVTLIERAHANEALEKIRDQLAEAQKIAHLGSFEYDIANGTTVWSDEQYRIHGFDPSGPSPNIEEIVSHCLLPEDSERLRSELTKAIERREEFDQEHRIVRPDGSVRWIHTQAHPRLDEHGRISCYVGTSLDISVRQAAEEKIRDLAFYDTLTGLPNRRLLADRLGQALAGSHRNHEFCALMMLDLDHFKLLNDTRGHDVGDRLLMQVAQRLVSAMRQEDTVARLGGDEFVVVINGLGADPPSAATQSELVAEKLRESLSEPYALGHPDAPSEPDYSCTPSIGLTLFRGAELPVELLMKQADVALYQAKSAGRNAVRLFDPAMQALIETHVALEAGIRNGLARDEFALHYQPQVDLAGRRIGAEALVRWMHPDRGMVAPVEFIPLAEETGLIVDLGQWVLDTACAQLKKWAGNRQTATLGMAVNVSARQFRQPDFVERVRRSLVASGADPARLKLELTESVILEDAQRAIDRMVQLNALGVSFSLDDFGTGYSSLSYLKRLPIEQIKIDQSFVRNIPGDANHAAIVQAILAMSSSLGLSVIAEGVETESQREFLQRHGCMSFQGYLFGRPAPIEEWECGNPP